MSRDDGEMVRDPDGAHCGVWVGHYGNDPDSEALEIQNVWGRKRRTQVTIPKDVVEDVVAALEERT
ncbi:hypothetical protein [Haladaptatus salinisoli]|uniref:hypothetical protein n=1 Tax=Haladaptatus salinisoli TaxID=2884876 RepID=UPI001D0A416A|nr:hypothetical protein [Haladaptatus salinisoli]